MKKIIIYVMVGLSVLIVVPVAFFGLRILFDLSNPLRQPVEAIRENLLELTPIGTSIYGVVLAIEENEDWEWDGRIASFGFPADGTFRTFIGEQSISFGIGGYTNIFRTGVVVWWSFDENSKLLDIHVQKNIFGW